MPSAGAERRLVAVLAADVVGYSKLMHADDRATLASLTEARALFAERAAARGGRVVNAPGDSILAEFASVREAVDCAVELQRTFAARGAALPEARRMQFRMGINVGDVLTDEAGALYGDGVNVAARLESLCHPGDIALSAAAYEQVRDKTGVRFVDRGEHAVKNIARPVHVYSAELGAEGRTRWRNLRPRRALAILSVVVAAGAAVAALLNVPRFLQKEPEAQAATIAVLPFANQGSEGGREYFSDGLTEDVIGALGRFSAVRVIAHNTVQAYKNRPTTPEQINRELGVRYIVQGSVRRADGALRIGIELSDATNGAQLWSQRYDGTGRDVFGIQDRIVRDIVGTLAVKLSALEQQRAAAKPPDTLEAYELVLRARELLRATERAANRDARSLIAQAVKLSPNYAEAYAALSYAEFQRAVFGWIEDPADGLRRSEEAARRALAIDDPGANARAHAMLGNIHNFTGNYGAGLADAERAIELNGSDAVAHSLRGGILLWTGRIDESIAASEAARRFDPRLPAEGMFNLALAYYLAGRYADAVQASVAVPPRSRTVFLEAVRAAALAQLGDSEGARRIAADVRRLDPLFDVKLFGARFVNTAHREKAQEGLRKAGL